MAHNSNSHDALWLPNSKTEMFSVYAGNARSSCLVVPHTRACRTEASIAETVPCPWDEAYPDGS